MNNSTSIEHLSCNMKTPGVDPQDFRPYLRPVRVQASQVAQTKGLGRARCRPIRLALGRRTVAFKSSDPAPWSTPSAGVHTPYASTAPPLVRHRSNSVKAGRVTKIVLAFLIYSSSKRCHPILEGARREPFRSWCATSEIRAKFG